MTKMKNICKTCKTVNCNGWFCVDPKETKRKRSNRIKYKSEYTQLDLAFLKGEIIWGQFLIEVYEIDNRPLKNMVDLSYIVLNKYPYNSYCNELKNHYQFSCGEHSKEVQALARTLFSPREILLKKWVKSGNDKWLQRLKNET